MSKFNFDKVLKEYDQLKRDLPQVMANDAQKFFSKSFNDGGFTNNGLSKWKIPQRKIPGTSSYKYPKNKGLRRRTRATLVQSGRLRREVSDSIRMVSFNRTVLNVSAPYAVYHNYGDGNMPKRKFMGRSKVLEANQMKKIKQALNEIWK